MSKSHPNFEEQLALREGSNKSQRHFTNGVCPQWPSAQINDQGEMNARQRHSTWTWTWTRNQSAEVGSRHSSTPWTNFSTTMQRNRGMASWAWRQTIIKILQLLEEDKVTQVRWPTGRKMKSDKFEVSFVDCSTFPSRGWWQGFNVQLCAAQRKVQLKTHYSALSTSRSWVVICFNIVLMILLIPNLMK